MCLSAERHEVGVVKTTEISTENILKKDTSPTACVFFFLKRDENCYLHLFINQSISRPVDQSSIMYIPSI